MFEKSLKSSLVFHPRKKDEIWRFITYQLCHGSFNHIFGNMLVSFEPMLATYVGDKNAE